MNDHIVGSWLRRRQNVRGRSGAAAPEPDGHQQQP
jgi:hypothetical protein